MFAHEQQRLAAKQFIGPNSGVVTLKTLECAWNFDLIIILSEILNRDCCGLKQYVNTWVIDKMLVVGVASRPGSPVMTNDLEVA
jgi:hypothetical protein